MTTKVDDGLRALFRQHLPMVQWTTVETGGTQSGVPDLEGCCGGAQWWLECKATKGWAVHVRPFQKGWHLRRYREGGASFIAVRRRCAAGVRRGPAVDDLYLYAGIDIVALDDLGIGKVVVALGHWTGGPSEWDWQRALNIMQHSPRPTPRQPGGRVGGRGQG